MCVWWSNFISICWAWNDLKGSNRTKPIGMERKLYTQQFLSRFRILFFKNGCLKVAKHEYECCKFVLGGLYWWHHKRNPYKIHLINKLSFDEVCILNLVHYVRLFIVCLFTTLFFFSFSFFLCIFLVVLFCFSCVRCVCTVSLWCKLHMLLGFKSVDFTSARWT